MIPRWPNRKFFVIAKNSSDRSFHFARCVNASLRHFLRQKIKATRIKMCNEFAHPSQVSWHNNIFIARTRQILKSSATQTVTIPGDNFRKSIRIPNGQTHLTKKKCCCLLEWRNCFGFLDLIDEETDNFNEYYTKLIFYKNPFKFT